MNLHLQAISRAITPGARGLLVIGGAGWHTSGIVQPPDNISLLCLPAYSPELNPVEKVWEYLRKNKLALRIHDRYADVVEACCKALERSRRRSGASRLYHSPKLGKRVMSCVNGISRLPSRP
jgi:DDE superfamily endonuclease